MALKLSADQFRRSFGGDDVDVKAKEPEPQKPSDTISATDLALARVKTDNTAADMKLAKVIESLTEKMATISDKSKSYKIKLTKIERKDGQIVDLEMTISPVS